METLGAGGNTYRLPDGTFAPCEVVREVIPVKGQPDAVEEVHLTPRGPILTPVLPDVPLAQPEMAAPAAADAGGDPLARKLELAEEFRQIGDMEGARDLANHHHHQRNHQKDGDLLSTPGIVYP